MSVYSTVIKGAREVYCVDYAPGRLALAKPAGAISINLMDGDPV